MKLTYEERLLVVEDHKRYGTAYTSRKWRLSERYVRTIVSKARNNSLSLNNKHTNYSAEFKIKVAKTYAEGKHSFEEIAQLYGIYIWTHLNLQEILITFHNVVNAAIYPVSC